MPRGSKDSAKQAKKHARKNFGQQPPPPKPPKAPHAFKAKLSTKSPAAVAAAAAAAAALARYRDGAGTSGAPACAAASGEPASADDAPASAPRRPRCPYAAGQRVLLLGDGDFSFAAALGLLWSEAGQLVATSFDDEAEARAKYAGLDENLGTVRSCGAAVHFGVDATHAHAHFALRNRAFDRVVFNFPHAGAGIKDQERNRATNQALLRGTFASVAQLLAEDGEVHITLKRGEPYDSWNAVAIAKMAGEGRAGRPPPAPPPPTHPAPSPRGPRPLPTPPSRALPSAASAHARRHSQASS